MKLFALAVVVALLGVGVYGLYNPGQFDVRLAGYHFAAVPTWVPVAFGAAVPLSLFLLHALWTGLRIWLLEGAVRREPEWELVQQWPPAPRRVEMTRPAPAPAPAMRRPVAQAPVAPPPAANPRRRRASQAPPPTPGPQPAPKRSWLSHRD